MGRLLTPILGIDMAASVAAASIATFGFQRTHLPAFDDSLEQSTVRAVTSRSESDLTALRTLVSDPLTRVAENGAAKMFTAPLMVTISAEPPSNH
jgi:hypothetical protein